MHGRTAATLCLCLMLGVVEARAQSPSSDDLQKQINTLNETERAILKELRDIKTLLQQQQRQPRAADVLPADPLDISKETFRGAANAKVALIEFSDYQCPFCAKYDKETYPQLLKEYVDAGKIK